MKAVEAIRHYLNGNKKDRKILTDEDAWNLAVEWLQGKSVDIPKSGRLRMDGENSLTLRPSAAKAKDGKNP